MKQELKDKALEIKKQMCFAVELQTAEWLDDREEEERPGHVYRTVGFFSPPKPPGPRVRKLLDSYYFMEPE